MNFPSIDFGFNLLTGNKTYESGLVAMFKTNPPIFLVGKRLVLAGSIPFARKNQPFLQKASS